MQACSVPLQGVPHKPFRKAFTDTPQNRVLRRQKCQAVPASFEPHIDSQAVAAQVVVLSATAATAAYWWWSVVPAARRTLAKQKRSGPLNSYLVDLQNDSDKRLERWFYTDWLQQLQRRQEMAQAAAAKRAASGAQPDMAADQQVQLRQRQHEGGENDAYQHSHLQEDDDKMPAFWSLDNPILATAALLAGAAAVGLLLHQ